MNLDPVCVLHGKRQSEHACLYCCLCFADLTPETCYEEADGTKVDVCVPCANAEQSAMRDVALNESGEEP